MRNVVFAFCLLVFALHAFSQTSSSLNHSEVEWRKLAVNVCDAANERTRLWEIVLPRPSMRWRKSRPFYNQLVLDVIWLTSRIERVDGFKERIPSGDTSTMGVQPFAWEESSSLGREERALLRVLVKTVNSDTMTNRMISYFQQMGIHEKAYRTLHRIWEAYQKEYESLKKILEVEYVSGMNL